MLIYQQEEKLSPRAREFLEILRSAATPAEAANAPAPSELPQLSVA
jgi:hypothetical protein